MTELKIGYHTGTLTLSIIAKRLYSIDVNKDVTTKRMMHSFHHKTKTRRENDE